MVILVTLIITKPTFIRKFDINERITDDVDIPTAIILSLVGGLIVGLVVKLHSIIS